MSVFTPERMDAVSKLAETLRYVGCQWHALYKGYCHGLDGRKAITRGFYGGRSQPAEGETEPYCQIEYMTGYAIGQQERAKRAT